MRTLIAILFLSTVIFAQHRGFNPTPVVTGGFGNVVFPGGTGVLLPGTTRSFGNSVFPGGGGPRIRVPFSITDPTFASRLGATVGAFSPNRGVGPGWQGGRKGNGFNGGGFGGGGGVVPIPYAVPVYVGGAYDYSYGGYPPDQQPAPNSTIVMAPQQPPMVMQPGAEYPQMATGPVEQPAVTTYQAPLRQPPPEGVSTDSGAAHYLIAFKDHTIYSAVAYWVDGQTLHYFTNGNTHNQVSLSLVDRPLTDRLNKEMGIDFRLPPQ
jgi:hypothetical protein